MPNYPDTLTFDRTSFAILVQIFGAFAHGAGGLMVEDEVILAATEDYAPKVDRGREEWASEGLQVLELTRAIGRLAAHRALSHGRVVIQHSDYRHARERVGVAVGAFKGCPFHKPF